MRGVLAVANMDEGDDEESEGRAPPRKRSKRPPIPRGVKPAQWEEFWARYDAGRRDAAKIAEEIGAGKRTVYRWLSLARDTANTEKRRRGFEPEPPELDGDDPAPSGQPGWDHMGVARRAAASDKVHVRDRLRAVSIIEQRRQWAAEHEREGRVDWASVRLEDIPHEHRARLAGLLAEVLVETKAPALGLADTTEAQAAVWYQVGLLLHPDDADVVYREYLLPAMAAALAEGERLGVAREAGARQIAAGASEVDAEGYLGHV